MNEIQVFSESELTSASFKELLPLFFDEVKEDFALLEAAVLSENLHEARRLSHKIKGCASSYAAVLINEKAFSMQSALTAEKGDVISNKISELQEAIDRSYEYAKIHFLAD